MIQLLVCNLITGGKSSNQTAFLLSSAAFVQNDSTITLASSFGKSSAAYLWLFLLSVNKYFKLSEADQIAVRALTGIHISLAAETGTSSSSNAICEHWHLAQSRTDQ